MCQGPLSQLRQQAQQRAARRAAVLVVTFEQRWRAEAYVQQSGCPWPLLLDTDRSLFRAYWSAGAAVLARCSGRRTGGAISGYWPKADRCSCLRRTSIDWAALSSAIRRRIWSTPYQPKPGGPPGRHRAARSGSAIYATAELSLWSRLPAAQRPRSSASRSVSCCRSVACAATSR